MDTLHSNKPRLVALALLAVLGTGITTAQAGEHRERYAAGHIIVKPRDMVSASEFTTVVEKHGGKDHNRVRATRLHIVNVAPGQEEAAVQALALDPSVEFAELDRLVAPEVTTANDTYYASAWHLAKIGAPTAWDSTKGAGVVVAILDSGVDSTHPDLAGKLVAGWNLYDNNSNTSDVYGHGTNVAGVVAALSNNGIGVTSIAGDAMIMPVRVSMTTGSAYISTIAAGITWAADHGAKIANASFATLTGSASIQNAANYMRSKGGLVVVAAGNYGVLDSTPDNGAVISVSATGSGDSVTSWSSFGPYVDVAAPGSGIWSTARGGGYAAVSGTSFSSPATCAVLALMRSANPSLSITQLESMLESTAVDLGTPGYDQYYGNGRINAAAAVAAALATGTTTPSDTQAPTVSITSPSGGTASSTVTVSVNASDNVGVTRVDLYAGSTLVGSDSTTPYSVNWNTTGTADGTVNLVARAYDAAGNQGSSASVAVTVANTVTADTIAPSVSILNPKSNSTVKSSVSISLAASDNVGLSTLSLYIDGSLRSVTNATKLSYSWNTRKIASGVHTISATAKDAAGNTTTRSVSVTR